MKQQKKLLYEVSIIRPLVIFLLVLLHSFTKITNGGTQTNDYQLSIVYQWFCWLISGFRIETIALIAGYVFAYQSFDLGRSYKFWPFVVKKFKRLIVPMLVFGLFYYFCFLYNSATFDIKSFLILLFSGCGHLWFLPMLFWCFLAIYVIDRFKWTSWYVLFLLALITIIPSLSLPFGLDRLPHFLFFVYAGYFLWTKRDWILQHCLNYVTICTFWIIYVSLVILVNVVMPTVSPEMTIMQKGMVYLPKSIIRLLASCCGIMALYLTVCKVSTKENYQPKRWIINASNNCYGVYVYHQFILVFLYFYTPLVSACHPLLVPWTGFILTISISLVFTYLSLKTKIGRLLIG